MTFNDRLQGDLIRLAQAGCGFRISARGRLINDLVDLAQAARVGNAHITISGVTLFSADDLIRIGRPGAGNIIFED
jgi:hypothetical protein